MRKWGGVLQIASVEHLQVVDQSHGGRIVLRNQENTGVEAGSHGRNVHSDDGVLGEKDVDVPLKQRQLRRRGRRQKRRHSEWRRQQERQSIAGRQNGGNPRILQKHPIAGKQT